MCQALFWAEVNKADQNAKCHGASIHPAGGHIELSSGLRNKPVEFLLWQMWLCGQEKKNRKGSEVGSMGIGKNSVSV